MDEHWIEAGISVTKMGFEFTFYVSRPHENGEFTGISIVFFVLYLKWGIMEK